MKYSIIALAGIAFLAGCAKSPVGSVAGGECKIVSTPAFAVKGKTTYDQEWVDDTTEAIVRGCAQPRPKARPAELDATHTVAGKTVPIPKPTKKHWWQRRLIKSGA